MNLPDYIDNQTHSLQSVIDTLILDYHQTDLDIATGFFRIEAWIRLERAFDKLTDLRLLIGRDPSILPAEPDRIDLANYFRRTIQRQLEGEPFNLEYKQQIERAIAFLQRESILVRLYGVNGNKASFLHAKAYIFSDYSIIGSSNFTPSGLEGNTELNVLIKQTAIARDLRQNWFDKFWNDESVDLEYKDKLIDALNASKFGSKAYTPYQVFVKALYELFKDDTGITAGDRTSLELASFQQEGFERAVKLLERHRSCMVADAVGLGKTFIGLRLLDHYLIKDKRPGYVPRALVICPAQLRDFIWNKKLDEFGIKAKVISQEELGREGFEIKDFSRYDLVVIDESHNFRNPGTNRYRNLQKLLRSGNQNKRVVLLTATPINNTLFDLYHQILLLARNNESYYREWGINNLMTYFRELNKGRVEITELLMQTMVRRSRQDVIKRQQAGEQIFIAGKEIRFPQRQLERFTYNFEGEFAGFYATIGNGIDRLNLSPYNIRAFKQKLDKSDEDQIQRNQALVALMKSLWLKRLESSLTAFSKSITNQRNFQIEFEKYLNSGKLLDSRTFRKIIALETDEEESITTTELIASLDAIDPAGYDLDALKQQIASDIRALDELLATVATVESRNCDLKIVEFKRLLSTLKGQKILVFSYFKDTADYIHRSLMADEDWLKTMSVNIDLITGSTPGKQRGEKVARFAPRANCRDEEDLAVRLFQPIDILICTDVLSEGQNLQDAGILINYDLHWNPVRMIQRAGRIDRIGTEYERLFIYNCFPEAGLEILLGLVGRLQQRIATIDREVGLDASVLGEVISDRSLEELRRLREVETDAEKAAILLELESAAELVSLDEMRFPLLEFMQQMGKEAAEEIPLGIHSTHTGDLDGLFLAFRARDRHFWHFYPRIDGKISTEPKHLLDEKRKIFKLLQCKAGDFPHPDTLPPVPFDNDIFLALEGATHNLIGEIEKRQSGYRLQPALSKLSNKIKTALEQSDADEIDSATKERLLSAIVNSNLKSYERDLRVIWDEYVDCRDLERFVTGLDDFFVDRDLYMEVETKERSTIEAIRSEDITLICYQWFESIDIS
jgi:superfamily II DNA or RNA helicase